MPPKKENLGSRNRARSPTGKIITDLQKKIGKEKMARLFVKNFFEERANKLKEITSGKRISVEEYLQLQSNIEAELLYDKVLDHYEGMENLENDLIDVKENELNPNEIYVTDEMLINHYNYVYGTGLENHIDNIEKKRKN